MTNPLQPDEAQLAEEIWAAQEHLIGTEREARVAELIREYVNARHSAMRARLDELTLQLSAMSRSNEGVDARFGQIMEALIEINKQGTECLERGRLGDTAGYPQPINYVCGMVNKARTALQAGKPSTGLQP